MTSFQSWSGQSFSEINVNGSAGTANGRKAAVRQNTQWIGCSQRTNQVLSSRNTPPRAKVVSSHRIEFIRAGRTGVVSSRDVMKAHRVIPRRADCVNGRVDKAHGRPSAHHRVLIDQRSEPGPQWRGATRASDVIILAVRAHVHIVRRQGDIRDVSFGG